MSFWCLNVSFVNNIQRNTLSLHRKLGYRKKTLTVYMMWWDRGKIVVASCILAAAAGTWSSAKYISANRSQICSCNSQARCGPGRGVNDDMDDATSESACSTLDAAREWACKDAATYMVI